MKKRRVLVLFSTVFVILLLILIVRCSEGFYGEIDLEKEQFPICDIELPPKKIGSSSGTHDESRGQIGSTGWIHLL